MPSTQREPNPGADPMPKKADFEATFKQLKEILKPYESKLVVASDTPIHYSLDTPHVLKGDHRIFFGGIKIGKNYVSYHLMPVYAIAEVRDAISPELKKRMQGKACFNFSSPDEKLFKELSKLTKIGFKKFTAKDFLSQIVRSRTERATDI
jgi:hypothetical protein